MFLAQKLTSVLGRSLTGRVSLSISRSVPIATSPALSIKSLTNRFSSSVSLTLGNKCFIGSTFIPSTSIIGINTFSLWNNNSVCQVRGFATDKHKRVIKQSKGFRGRANRCYRVAIRRLEKSWQYAYRDRKVKKREFRKLWITRLNAGVRQHDVSYSNFINMQSKSGVMLDRKILSGLAMYEPFTFKAVVDVIKMQATEGTGK